MNAILPTNQKSRVYFAEDSARCDRCGERKPACVCANPATEADGALTMQEVGQLRWFFCQSESDLGVRCTFGAQLEAAIAQRMSDEAIREARQIKSLRTQLRKGRKGTRVRGVSPEIAAAVLAHLGLGVDGNTRSSRVDLSDEYIYMRSPVRPAPSDPFERDDIVRHTQLARRIEARLQGAGARAFGVLKAAYGPASGEWSAPMCEEDYVEKHGNADGFRFNSERATAHKKFGDLLEIVVRLVRAQRKDTDPIATRIILAKINDDSFVRVHRHSATGYLRNACIAYAGTRS